MPKQEFEFVDYTAPFVAGLIFAVILFLLCIVINFTCITKKDDHTKFEKLGARYNVKLGPHSLKRRDEDEKGVDEDRAPIL